MSININTTHTVTCDNAPVEEVYAELDEKFPQLNPLVEQKLQLREERDIARGRAVARTRERDEVRKQLEESQTVKEKLMAENANLKAANETILAAGSRPALHWGIRLAEHEKYGRVVVPPSTNPAGNRPVYCLGPIGGGCVFWVPSSELTFLDEEPSPVPAPLPKPEDCKAGEVYRAMVLRGGDRTTRLRGSEGSPVVAMRNDPGSEESWNVIFEDSHDWCTDSEVTLLARLLPDRKVRA